MFHQRHCSEGDLMTIATEYTSYDCIDAIVKAQGNLNLAAERLHISPSTLTLIISQDPQGYESLQRQLRILTLLSSSMMLHVAQIALQTSIADLTPFEASKTYLSLLDSIQTFTDPHTQTQNSNVNITEVVMRMLPPSARQALLDLVAIPIEPLHG